MGNTFERCSKGAINIKDCSFTRIVGNQFLNNNRANQFTNTNVYYSDILIEGITYGTNTISASNNTHHISDTRLLPGYAIEEKSSTGQLPSKNDYTSLTIQGYYSSPALKIAQSSRSFNTRAANLGVLQNTGIAIEGTFYPTIGGSILPGIQNYTNGVRRGYYQKFGDIVYFSLLITITGISGATGNLVIADLPFKVKDNTLTPECAITIGFLDGITGNASTTYFSAYTVPNTFTILLLKLNQGSSNNQPCAITNLNIPATVKLSGWYFVEPSTI